METLVLKCSHCGRTMNKLAIMRAAKSETSLGDTGHAEDCIVAWREMRGRARLDDYSEIWVTIPED